jgi:hypothetical protein
VAEATQQLRIVISPQDQASAVFQNLGREMTSFAGRMAQGIGARVGFVVVNQAAQAIGQAFRFASDAVFGFNSSLEQSRI